MSTIKVTIALLTGIAAGAAAGLLFAPQTGTETRDKLIESLTDITDSIKETAAKQLDSLGDNLKAKVLDVIKLILGDVLPDDEPADDLEHA